MSQTLVRDHQNQFEDRLMLAKANSWIASNPIYCTSQNIQHTFRHKMMFHTMFMGRARLNLMFISNGTLMWQMGVDR